MRPSDRKLGSSPRSCSQLGCGLGWGCGCKQAHAGGCGMGAWMGECASVGRGGLEGWQDAGAKSQRPRVSTHGCSPAAWCSCHCSYATCSVMHIKRICTHVQEGELKKKCLTCSLVFLAL